MGEGFQKAVRDLCTEQLTNDVLALSPDDQWALVKRVASNIGYKLMPEDYISVMEDRAEIEVRIAALEGAVHELNPGWLPPGYKGD